MIEFKIPPVGENIESGSVIKIHVKSGDIVKKDQDLLEMETDKATVPIPSPCDGTIKEVLIKEGEDVKVGQTVLKIEESGDGQTEDKKQRIQDVKDAAGKQEKAEEESRTQKPPPDESKNAEDKKEEQPQPAQAAQPPDKKQKVVVIGGGPGGYAAAFLAADLGMDITLIDKEKNPGGVCLFRGCIPSKALLHVAKILSETKEAKDMGLDFAEPTINLDKVRSWKDGIVKQLTGGLGQLCERRKVQFIQGQASFINSNTIKVDKPGGGSEEISFDKAVVATGSVPVTLPFAPESKRVLDSTSALDIQDIPDKLLVIGGGYIGLELGTVYCELGSKVTVVEMLPNLLMGADRDLAMILEKRIKQRFEKIMTNTKVTGMNETDKSIKVSFEDKDGNKSEETYSKVLVAIGRKPVSKGLGLENTKVKVTDRGFIEVNSQRQTADPNIYAIGDIAGDPMLAHKASHEGRVAIEAIAGHKVAFEPAAIPAVVFTDPEIAWCGLTESEAKKQGRDIRVVKFPWGASGRALTLNRTDGVTKLIVDPKTERILGVAICGVGAGEMISEGVIAVEMGSVVTDLKLSIHPHPTLSETVMESAEVFFGQSSHIYTPKRK